MHEKVIIVSRFVKLFSLCTADLEGNSITTVETSTIVKKVII